jgi:hypothetical protein
MAPLSISSEFVGTQSLNQHFILLKYIQTPETKSSVFSQTLTKTFTRISQPCPDDSLEPYEYKCIQHR